MSVSVVTSPFQSNLRPESHLLRFWYRNNRLVINVSNIVYDLAASN